MDETFDPYHKWLGIRDRERPPNHYRLLGLEYFEDDRDVIALAADRQMAHIRTFQTGPHSALSQRLLNEMAAARVCLLNPQRKAAYDQRLYAELEAAALAALPTVPVALPVPQDKGPTEEGSGAYSSPLGETATAPAPLPPPLPPDRLGAAQVPGTFSAPLPPPVVTPAPIEIMPVPGGAPLDEGLSWPPARLTRQRRKSRRQDPSAAMWLVVAALLGLLVLLLILGGQARP